MQGFPLSVVVRVWDWVWAFASWLIRHRFIFNNACQSLVFYPSHELASFKDQRFLESGPY